MTTPETPEGAQLWTIGHWTCSEPEFLRPLDEQGVELIADVRAQPGSRRTPHFDQDRMPRWLAGAGIGYLHLPELGGRRPKQQVDPAINGGWQNMSFRNYADYTLTAPYRQGIERLTKLATDQRVAVLCGEPMPWRCHRLLIANTFAARGWTVWHLVVGAAPRRHELGRWGAAPTVDAAANVTYPAIDGDAAR